MINVIGFCKKSLNGKMTVTGVKLPASETLSLEDRQEALSNGFLILGPFTDNTLKIIDQRKPAERKEEKAQKKSEEPKEKEDKDSPFYGYYPPSVVDDIISLLEDPATSNSWLFGPTQCGKSVAVDYIGYVMKRKVFTINCVGDMPSSHFFGRRSVVIDPDTKQNHIMFIKGIVEESMTEGLDDKGNVIGPPSILFIDEAAAMPPIVGIGLNRTLQTNKNVRELVLPEDGNRVVKSHPGWRVIMAGNTNGSGANSAGSQIYAAQKRAMDASLMERVTMFFRFGYDRSAEQKIAEKFLTPYCAEKFLTFKQSIRDNLKTGNLMTPFSTKRVIDICTFFKMFKKEMSDNLAMAKAMYYTSFEKLLPEEKAKYNEFFYALFNVNLTEMAPKDECDFI